MEAGFFVGETKLADICIVNTCSVTDLADKKSRQAISQIKKQNPNIKVVVTGCGAKAEKVWPEVALWIPNKDKEKVLEIIQKQYFLKAIDNSEPDNSNFILKSKFKNLNSGIRTRALLKIQDGCNNFCAYCIVPHLRGREVSFPVGDVLKEAKKLEQLGYKELVLTGVNVGKYSQKYGTTELDLTGLIKLILTETSFPRIRLSSINPQDVSEEMVTLWSNEPRLCKHFHLSLQSGSNKILKEMGRPYSAEYYLTLCKKIIQKMPTCAITTDVIVGFPGENDKAFQESIELVMKAKLAKLHVFRYSKRKGTRAAASNEQVIDSTKKERSKMLIELGKKLEKEFRSRFIGKELEVLFEEEKDGIWYGLTDNYLRVGYKSSENLENCIRAVELK